MKRAAWRVVFGHARTIAARHRVSPVVLLGSRRTGRAPRARDELAWTLRTVEGWSNRQIADELGRDRWWVSRAIAQHGARENISPIVIPVIARPLSRTAFKGAPTAGARA
jgi:hypothetical protein